VLRRTRGKIIKGGKNLSILLMIFPLDLLNTLESHNFFFLGLLYGVETIALDRKKL
jgi:hypothetical protein